MADITDDAPTLDDVIRLYVIGVCVACGWHLGKAASVLQVSLKTVYNHLNRYEDQGFLVKNMRGKGFQLASRKAA